MLYRLRRKSIFFFFFFFFSSLPSHLVFCPHICPSPPCPPSPAPCSLSPFPSPPRIRSTSFVCLPSSSPQIPPIPPIFMAADILNPSCSSKPPSPSNRVFPSCSVCLDAVSEDAGERSIAKLKCGHYFHLDCIGSAFNAKGRMQCPNCRHIEQGQWLYANGCVLHEDFVDDLTIDEDEAYSGAINMQISGRPWCPHQGSYVSFTFEASDDIGNAYMEPAVNAGVGSRMPPVGGHICPYLATHGLSIGVPSPHVEEVFRLHAGHHRTSRYSRRAGGFHSAAQRNFGPQQTSAAPSRMSYEGTSQSYNAGNFSQSNGNHQHNLDFSVGIPQSLHAGASQGSSLNNGMQMFGQLPIHPAHSTMNTARSGYVGTRQTAHREYNVASHRNLQLPSTDRTRAAEPIHEFNAVVASGAVTQMSNPIVGPGVAWSAAVGSQVDPWTTRIYASQPSSSQWWAWVPHASSRVVANGVPNPYSPEGQFFNAGLFPRSRVRFNNGIY